MARHREFSLATDIQVYFCDPHSTVAAVMSRDIADSFRQDIADINVAGRRDQPQALSELKVPDW
jgi:hypothetical protein